MSGGFAGEVPGVEFLEGGVEVVGVDMTTLATITPLGLISVSSSVSTLNASG